MWLLLGNVEGMESRSKPPILPHSSYLFSFTVHKGQGIEEDECRVAMVSSPEFSLDCTRTLGLHMEEIIEHQKEYFLAHKPLPSQTAICLKHLPFELLLWDEGMDDLCLSDFLCKRTK